MAQVYHKGDNVCIIRTIGAQGWEDIPLSEMDITAIISDINGNDKYTITSDEMLVDDDTDTITILLLGEETKDMSGIYFCRCEIRYNGQVLHTNNIETVEII